MGSPRKTPAERRAALVARIEKAKAAHESARARAGMRRTSAAWDASGMAYERWCVLTKKLAEMDADTAVRDLIMLVAGELDYDLAKSLDPATAEEPEEAERCMCAAVKRVTERFTIGRNEVSRG